MGKLIYAKTFKGTVVDTALRANAPTINPLNPQPLDTKVTFTLTNNEETVSTIFYGLESEPLTNFVVLDGNTTSDELELGDGNLLEETQYTIKAFTQTPDKITSAISSEETTTAKTVFYINATGGTILEYDFDGKSYRSHTFTTSGNFEVTAIPSLSITQQFEERAKIDYLIVSGGGNGGNTRGGGGGAGGYHSTLGTSGDNTSPQPKINANIGTYNITIGAGGAGSGTGSRVFMSDIEDLQTNGGGAGGSNSGAGSSGGSGGGGAGGAQYAGGGGAGGLKIAGQGTNGVAGTGGSMFGVGAGSRGGSAGGSVGLENILRTGSSEIRAVGGLGSQGSAVNGSANTGNGGAGRAASGTGGNGGSGIVIVRYEIEPTS